ncbi:E3 ubiquitin-protein ligase CHIP [Magnolia sinica]|uniref:E3 ubiquitin-protein ligase CHIP n=1 Tax=Magnolia sinica TaxID=86752 RepID=UPI0026595529|nr:E3 ubiquitin-protein ligase CHIP [Magnolia sinica]
MRSQRKMATVVASAAKQAELLKQDGNLCFKKDRFGAAIDAYTEAITLCPDVPVYWTNRALCYRKKNNWTKVEEDCRKAIELDGSSVKGHYMLGLALLERQEYAEGVKELDKALDLGRGANPNGYMVEEIWQELAKAKYLEWEDASSKREWKLRTLKEACETALAEKHFLDSSQPQDGNDEDANAQSEELKSLEEVFRIAAEADRPTEVPDYLCCKITFDIFRDPVITPSGVTYERAVLLDHLQKVGKFDPITREPLDQHQLAPNLAIKEAVQAYLDKHGWAYKTS